MVLGLGFDKILTLRHDAGCIKLARVQAFFAVSYALLAPAKGRSGPRAAYPRPAEPSQARPGWPTGVSARRPRASFAP